jgi:ABC-type multidrug transport system permease subunit
VGVFLIPLLALVFGILAISSANQSRQMLGYSLPDAQTGHTLGMVGVIGFCVIIGLVFFIVIAVTAAL